MRSLPKIFEAKRIIRNNLCYRDADLSDAEFILELRTDIRTNTYLSTVSPSLSEQISWLEDYPKKDDQAYFIIEDRQKINKMGTTIKMTLYFNLKP